MKAPFMGYLEVKNWLSFQHYKNRNPPWIKLHYEILTSRDWVMLDDKSKLLAVVCMMIASRNGGQVPCDAEYIMKVAHLHEEPDFKPLVKCGFLIDASGCLQALADASTKTEERQRREETETEREQTEKSQALAEEQQPNEVGQAPKYAFTGKVVNLKRDDLRKWEEKFPTINVIEHLKGIDKTYAARIGTPDEGKNKSWFFSAYTALAKADNEKRLQRPQGEAWV